MARKEALLAENGGYFYKGYLEVMRRHLFTRKEPVAQPLRLILTCKSRLVTETPRRPLDGGGR